MTRTLPISSLGYDNQSSITQTATLAEETQLSSSLHSVKLDNKVQSVTIKLQDHFVNLLKKQSSENVETIADYIPAMNVEEYFKAGYTKLYPHSTSPDEIKFIQDFSKKVFPYFNNMNSK